MFACLLLGWGILACFAPWTTAPAGSAGAHDTLGYAAIWSQRYSTIAGARVDTGAFAFLSGVVAFFAIGIAAAAYFFRTKRGSEREDL
jgi:hypothetical protein